MKVLLLGSTGNVGSRVLAALLAHGYEPILYVRNASKLPQSVLTSLSSSSIVTGDATDIKAIEKAIQEHECEAVISAAGLAGIISRTEQFPAIFRSVVEAAASVGRQRGKPVRTWMLAGFAMLDIPNSNGTFISNYLPFFPDHKENYALLQSTPQKEVAWSLLCPSAMGPSKEADAAVQTKANSAKIIATADVPPNWSNSLRWIPLFGTFLNILVNSGSYLSTLEEAAEVIVRDLDKGSSSEFIGHRVGLKVVK